MRIAHVAPLFESVPPKLYGGTERVVAYLTDELVRMRHDVTLFASGDSHTAAKLVPCGKRATRLDPGCEDDLAPQVLQIERVIERAAEFDVIHFHSAYVHLLAARRLSTPYLTTAHGRLDRPQLQSLLAAYPEAPFVSVSRAQRDEMPGAAWAGTVHHGLPLDLHRFVEAPQNYFAFLGRISPEKGVTHAIEISRRLGVPLKIAAKVGVSDRSYYRRTILPLLRAPLVEFLGEIDERRKGELLGGARALLFPIEWPEPFGMVLIESLICGTPVVAFGRGSVPELIDEGVTGFVVDDIDAAVAAAARIDCLDRRRCREVFEQRFSAQRMARDYLAIYANLIATWRSTLARGRRPRLVARDLR